MLNKSCDLPYLMTSTRLDSQHSTKTEAFTCNLGSIVHQCLRFSQTHAKLDEGPQKSPLSTGLTSRMVRGLQLASDGSHPRKFSDATIAILVGQPISGDPLSYRRLLDTANCMSNCRWLQSFTWCLVRGNFAHEDKIRSAMCSHMLTAHPHMFIRMHAELRRSGRHEKASCLQALQLFSQYVGIHLLSRICRFQLGSSVVSAKAGAKCKEFVLSAARR